MKYQCPKCKGTNIDIKVWLKLNLLENKSIERKNIETLDSNDYWCNDCEEHIKPEEIK
jgi:Zn finger protein HypA/HybF involved in hydrogenase expression